SLSGHQRQWLALHRGWRSRSRTSTHAESRGVPTRTRLLALAPPRRPPGSGRSRAFQPELQSRDRPPAFARLIRSAARPRSVSQASQELSEERLVVPQVQPPRVVGEGTCTVWIRAGPEWGAGATGVVLGFVWPRLSLPSGGRRASARWMTVIIV